MKSKQKIYLIGLPGTGKSYFGKILAEATGFEFADLDKIIEEKEGRTISTIFETDGEDYFRRTESTLLRSFSEKEEFILATGGGSPCFHDGISFMNENGITIYLTQDRETLIERISRKSHRPLMQGDVENRIDELLRIRSKFYNQADITISHRDATKAMNEIDKLKS
ncbi:MAG: shikimate kinase [Cyclobacteriaceae bacterium]